MSEIVKALSLLGNLKLFKVIGIVIVLWLCVVPNTIHAQVVLSGQIYNDAGVTNYNGSPKNIRVAVGTSTTSIYNASTTGPSGNLWSITIPSGHEIATGTRIAAWIDGDPSMRGSVLTKAIDASSTRSIAGLDIYKNRVIVRNEATSATSTTVADFAFYTFTQDPDLPYIIGSSGDLRIFSGYELYVWANKTFAPGAPVVVSGNASTTATDGSFYMAANSVYVASSTLTLGGSFAADSTASIIGYLAPIVFNATTTGKTISAPAGTMGHLTFNGVGGAWSMTGTSSVKDLKILRGTVTAPATGRLNVYGVYINYASFIHNSGELYMFGPTSTSSAGDIASFAFGRDISGGSGGTGSVAINNFAATSTYMYVVSSGNTTACSQISGSANGCELRVYDISTPTNPVYVAGRDADGSSAGTSSIAMNAVSISGSYLYVVKAGVSTACSQTAGFAQGCELMVFNISSSTNPIYVAGRDSGGNATGVQVQAAPQQLAISGTVLYMVKGGSNTACSQTAGSAVGCEIMVWSIASSTNPVYVAGRDVNGDTTGTGNLTAAAVAIASSTLYVVKAGSATACAQTTGTGAGGCELIVFDISSSTNPLYRAGRDVSGSSAGTGNLAINFLTISDQSLFIGKAANATACSQTAGSAIGCELMVFDISSSTNPVYVAGRDVGGTDAGVQSIGINQVLAVGSLLYVSKTAAAIACEQQIGRGTGCELMIFDISSSSLPTYIAGRDVGGDSSGVRSLGITGLAVTNDVLFMSKAGSATACSQVAGSAIGCEMMGFNVVNKPRGLMMGNMVGSNRFSDVYLSDYITFLDNASTTGFTLLEQNASGTATKAPLTLSVDGDFVNNGIFTANRGEVVMSGSSVQTISGFASGDSSFFQLRFTGAGSKNFDAVSNNVASSTNIIIDSGTTVVAPNILTVSNSFVNNGTFVSGTGTVQTNGYLGEFLAGVSSGGGTSTDVQTGNHNSLALKGDYLYVAKSGSATACSQVAGSAVGCELMVYNMASSTNPVYVAGRDVTGNATGVGNHAINTITINGNFLYVAKSANATACSQTAGSAIGCELMVFDISSSTNPVYVAGRDTSGSAAGTGDLTIETLVVSNSSLYVGKPANATACSQTAGSAIGCELMVFDISSSTNPVYVAGRDASGDNVGVGSLGVEKLYVSSTTLYVVKVSSATACSQTAGSAIGCELMVFDISSSTNPVYVAGRDASGSAAGTGNVAMQGLAVSNSSLYVAKAGNATACSQNAGSANGCELMVFNISSTTNPVYVAGRDVSGSKAGIDNVAINTVNIYGEQLYAGTGGSPIVCTQAADEALGCEILVFDVASSTNPVYVFGRDGSGLLDGRSAGVVRAFSATGTSFYIAKSGDSIACEQTVGLINGCELSVFQLPAILSGSFTGTSALNGLETYGKAIIQSALASTTDVVINAGSAFTAPATSLTISGNFTQNGTFAHNIGSVYFSGTSLQIATGTMTGNSKFYNLGVTNTSGNGITTQSVAFGAPITATGTFSMAASTSASFRKGSTNSINNLSLQGRSSVSETWLRSSESGQEWYLDVDGTKSVNYANVKDSDATAVSGGVTSGGGTDSGNNTNWFFNGPAIWNDTDWTQYDTLTIDATKIDTTLTDFPVYVNMADLSDGFWSTITSSGGDIRITTDDGTPLELAREIVSASTTLQTGEMYFKANSISSTTDTVFRIYYNGTATNYANDAIYGAQNVWTNDFLAVYHLGENPAAGVDAIQDSTEFQNHGTASTTMTSDDSVTGKVGKALDFDEVVSDVVIVGTSTSLANIAPISVCTWFQQDTLPAVYAGLIDKSSDGQDSWNMYLGNANEFGFLSRSGGYKEVTSVMSGWQYLCSTADDNAGDQYITQYKNGVNLGGAGGELGVGSDDTDIPLRIGSSNEAYPVDGRIDEVRISSSTRTASWIKAEYYNQSTTTEFYTITASAIVGSSTLSNHDGGQVADAFNSQNKTDTSLFAFKITPHVVPATVNNIVLTLAGVQKLSSSSFSSIRLYRDHNGDGLYDATDTEVDGSGVMSFSGQQGTLTFSADFTATTSLNYIVVANWTAPQNGSFMTISLPLSGLTITDIGGAQDLYGSASSVQHSRNNKGGGIGATAEVGGEAPAGDGIRTGGSNIGGEQIGDDPNFKSPSAQSGSWQNAARAYDGVDGTYATTSSSVTNNFTNHGFSVPGTNTIGGIELKLEISGSTGAGTIDVQLSWDGGNSWTSVKSTPTLTTTDTVRTLGGSSDLWGRTWTSDEFTNGNFAVRITGNPSSNIVQVDAIQVRIYHQSGGGGGGGGGEI